MPNRQSGRGSPGVSKVCWAWADKWLNTDSCWKEAYSQAQPRHGSVQGLKATMQEIGKTRQAELGRIQSYTRWSLSGCWPIKDAFAHFRNLKAACLRKVSAILDDHGNLISDKAVKAHRWKNHFEQPLNHPQFPVLTCQALYKKTSRSVENHLSWKYTLLYENWRMAKPQVCVI